MGNLWTQFYVYIKCLLEVKLGKDYEFIGSLFVCLLCELMETLACLLVQDLEGICVGIFFLLMVGWFVAVYIWVD